MAQVAASSSAAAAASRAPIPYADASYWDSRYSKQPISFDWFYGWTALRRVIRTYLPKRKQLLQVGSGNSTLQEGMAADGYKLTNVDISAVVVEQMRAAHAHVPGLEYVVGDARDMGALFPTCTFWGALDKGTIDALLCCKEGSDNVARMCAELARVLRPGCHFVAISLGEPSQRLPLLCRPEFGWQVSVLLLPRLPGDQMVQAPGRVLPVNDTLEPVKPIGPLAVAADHSVEGLPQPWDPNGYFYVYACRKAPLELQVSSKVKGLLPESWRSAMKQSLAKLQAEMGLQPDLFKKGVRRRTMRMSTFMAQQQQQQGQPAGARLALAHSRSQVCLPGCASAWSSAAGAPDSPQHQHHQHQHQHLSGLQDESGLGSSSEAGHAGQAGGAGSSDTTSGTNSSEPLPVMRRSISADDGTLYFLTQMLHAKPGAAQVLHTQAGSAAAAGAAQVLHTQPVSAAGPAGAICAQPVQPVGAGLGPTRFGLAAQAAAGSGNGVAAASHAEPAHPAGAGLGPTTSRQAAQAAGGGGGGGAAGAELRPGSGDCQASGGQLADSSSSSSGHSLDGAGSAPCASRQAGSAPCASRQAGSAPCASRQAGSAPCVGGQAGSAPCASAQAGSDEVECAVDVHTAGAGRSPGPGCSADGTWGGAAAAAGSTATAAAGLQDPP